MHRFHTALIPTLVRPGKAEVLVPEPEFFILRIRDEKYRRLRAAPGTRKTFLDKTQQ